tara:strand:+ start:387 stop:602 length:216 start_codon:yes stop_codon:yes gene_type:complete
MKELIITIGILVGMAHNQVEKIELMTTIDNIQDMKEWMIEDRNNGVISADYAEYYIQYLEESEQILINITD